MEYEKVPHSHIVPAGYLRAWAHGPRIGMRLVGSDTSRPVGVRDAGVRSNFYRRTRPETGEAIYDVEWSLRQAEDAAIPLLRTLPERWPLDSETRGKIGQFFALQHVRGPAFKAWHDAHTQHAAEALARDPAKYATPPEGMTPEEAIEQYTAWLTSDTYRATKMLKIVRSVATVLSSMHWSLIEFHKPRLATSDHPVVVWPFTRGPARPQRNDLDNGIANAFEVFAPLGPSSLLLMTWLNDEDPRKPLRGAGRHVATANAFVIANADAQWFHEVGEDPWQASGRRQPLSHELVPGYDRRVGELSPRREEAQRLAKQVAEAPLSNDPLPMVAVARTAA